MSQKRANTEYLALKKSGSLDDCLNYLLPHYDDELWVKEEIYNLLWGAHDECRDIQLYELISNHLCSIDSSGMGYLGRLYRDGRGVEKNNQQAIYWLTKASDCDNRWARNELFHLLWCFNDKKIYNNLKEIAEKYSALGDPVATGYLARLYRDGKYIEQNLEKSLHYYRQVLDKKIFWINREYIDLLWTINSSDSNKELYDFVMANKNDSYCLGYLARIYRDGRFVKSNYGLAIEYYQKASKNHISWASNELMDLLWKIHKTDSLELLFDMIVIGLSKDDPYCYGYMARYLKNGIGTDIDIQSSIDMYKKAASSGIKWAITELYSLLWSENMYSELLIFSDKYIANNSFKSIGSIGYHYHTTKTPIWVAFVGSINVKVEFLSTLMWCLDKRNKKMVEGIVFCTWDDQIDKYSGLRQYLIDVGVIVREIKYPVYSTDKVGFNSRELQELQLKGSLDCIPNNSIVIKCRTDLTIDWLVNHESELFDKTTNNTIDWGSCDIRSKIMPERNLVPLIPPFRFGDPAFCCHKHDILKILDFTNTELSGFDYSPDDRLFQIHAKEFPIITEFIKYVKIEMIVRYKSMGQDFELPPILNKVYALYFVIISKCYRYTSKNNCNYKKIEDVFLLNNTKGSRLKELDISVIDAICNGNLEHTPGFLSLYKLIKEYNDYDVAKKVLFTVDDWIKTAEWGIIHLSLLPEQWLKWPTYPSPRKMNVCIDDLPSMLDYSDQFLDVYSTITKGKRLKLEEIKKYKSTDYELFIDCLVYQIRKWDINSLDLYLDEFELNKDSKLKCFSNTSMVQRICTHSNLYLQLLRFKLISNSSENYASIIGDFTDNIKIPHAENLEEMYKHLMSMIETIVSNMSPNYRKKVWEEELHMLLCGHTYFELPTYLHKEIEKILSNHKNPNLDDKYLKKLCELYVNKKTNKKWAKYYLKMLSSYPNYRDYCTIMLNQIQKK